MSVTSGGTALNGLSAGGSWSSSAGSAGMVMTFCASQASVAPLAFVLAVPEEDRGGEVGQADDGVDEAVGLGRVVRRAQLERDLMLLAQVERLHVAPLAQVPEVQAVAVLAVEQQLGLHPGLDHVRRAPLAGDHRVVAEVPPEVVVQVLLAAVDLPAAEHVEGVVVEHEDRRPARRRPARRGR